MFRIASVVVLLSMILLASPILAQDASEKYCTANTEDNSGLPKCLTDKDNECYTGGVFEGKCNNQWMWDAGWYLARYNRGEISRASFPVQYESVLPPLAKPAPIVTVCKIGFGNRYCASSDKTGTRDGGNDGSVEEVQAFLPPGSTVCPAGYNGPSSIPGWHGGLFSDADLAPLGMNNTWMYCYKIV